MRKVVVILESSRCREVYPMGSPRERAEGGGKVLLRVWDWLASAERQVEGDGVCRSFSIGIHTAGEDCDHEQVEVRS